MHIQQPHPTNTGAASTDRYEIPAFQEQVENVRLALLRKLGNGRNSKPPPYNPSTVETLCRENGAPTLFATVVEMMTPTRTDRAWTNKHQKQAKCLSVVTLYIMFYGQSQLCNWLQKDLAVFSHTDGLSDLGLDALHTMGLSVSRETLHQFVKQAAALHQRHINSVLQEAINKEKRISPISVRNTGRPGRQWRLRKKNWRLEFVESVAKIWRPGTRTAWLGRAPEPRDLAGRPNREAWPITRNATITFTLISGAIH